MALRNRFALTLGLIAVLGATAGALGQTVNKKKTEPPKQRRATPHPEKQADTPAPEARPTAPVADKVLTLEKSKDWTMTIHLRVRAAAGRELIGDHVVEHAEPLKLRSAAVVFPMLSATAGHRLELDASNKPRYTGELTFNSVVMDSQPTFTDGYAGGTKLARWEMRDVEGNDCTLRVEYMMTCWETVFDEQLAATIPWPKGAWPAQAASVLKPDLFVQSDDPGIQELVKGFVEEHDPKSQPPSVLAKFLAGEVLKMVQPSGDGLDFNRDSTFRGFRLKGAAAMVAEPRGSPHDVACLLAAVYRAAGLPARIVIGFDRDDAAGGGNDNPLLARQASQYNLRSWVEFALVDPFDSKVFWIPVDIVRLRKSSTRPPSFDTPWPFFGTHSELSGVLPIAFQFHPPTSVTSMSPSFWGWITTPETFAMQSMRFSAIRTPQRGDEPSRSNRPAPKGDK